MSVAQTAQGTKEVRARLARAQHEGEAVIIRYTRGRTHPFTTTCAGIVDGFVRRAREGEKVRIQRPGQARIRADVPLAAIVAVETAVVEGERL